MIVSEVRGNNYFYFDFLVSFVADFGGKSRPIVKKTSHRIFSGKANGSNDLLHLAMN